MIPTEQRIFYIRHGKSEANKHGIIVSKPENGVGKYGLVSEGIQQVRESVAAARNKLMQGREVVIFASNFKRTRETAQIAAEVLAVETLIFQPLLWERNFGRLELTSSRNYHHAWRHDRYAPILNRLFGIEATDRVQKRVVTAIKEAQQQYPEHVLLFVSHGDPLQIAQTHYAGISSRQHRQLPAWQTAEIRQF